jgi:hypothetical protein
MPAYDEPAPVIRLPPTDRPARGFDDLPDPEDLEYVDDDRDD